MYIYIHNIEVKCVPMYIDVLNRYVPVASQVGRYLPKYGWFGGYG